MHYLSSTIAGYFIEKSVNEKAPLSVLQLIKLVYISHGWNLALNNKPLIRNDADFAKQYLAGFYGGAPVLTE